MNSKSKALIDSLKHAPLLAGNIASTPVFDRRLFDGYDKSRRGVSLNFAQKLGHLYEDALESLINACPSLSLIARNLQIFAESGQTLGELDFVIRDIKRQEFLHLELAVKFYLALETPDGWFYPGPNATDNWHRKLARMRKHQFALSAAPEAKRSLSEQFQIEEIAARQLIYGCLFTPIGRDTVPAPEFISPKRQRGLWLYQHQWDDHFKNIEHLLMIPKPLWPIELSENTFELLDPITAGELQSLAADRCVMFTHPSCGHSQRYFLVPEDWGENLR